MHALNRSTRGVIHALEGSIPFESDGSRTGNAGFAGHTLGGTVAGEVLSEDATIVVLFLVLWRVDGETLGSMGHLLIRNSF